MGEMSYIKMEWPVLSEKTHLRVKSKNEKKVNFTEVEMLRQIYKYTDKEKYMSNDWFPTR